jgi:hypothetical protein
LDPENPGLELKNPKLILTESDLTNRVAQKRGTGCKKDSKPAHHLTFLGRIMLGSLE